MSDTETAPDEDLLRRIGAGDVDAMAVLFRRRQGNVYRFALHLSGSESLADDVTQDVFVSVMRDASRYEAGRATVGAWLCGIARNHVRRRLTFDAGFSPLEDESGDDEHFAAVSADPLGDLTTAEEIERLRRAVLSLPMKYREPIVLCDLQEMSYADAASALGCPVGTVRSRLNRARGLLVAKMQGQRHAERAMADRMKRCLA